MDGIRNESDRSVSGLAPTGPTNNPSVDLSITSHAKRGQTRCVIVRVCLESIHRWPVHRLN